MLIWKIYPKKLILKGKSEFCRDVYSCPKYYHLKLETANPERLTNLLKYCIHWDRMWSWGVAIMMEERGKMLYSIVIITASKNSIQTWNEPQGDVSKRKLESNSHNK